MSMTKRIFILMLTGCLLLGFAVFSYGISFQEYGIHFQYPRTFELVGNKTNSKTSIVKIANRKKFSNLKVSVFRFRLQSVLEDMALNSTVRKFRKQGCKNVKFSRKTMVKLPFNHIKGQGKIVTIKYELEKVKFLTNIYFFNHKERGYIIDLTKPMGAKVDFDFFFKSFQVRQE